MIAGRGGASGWSRFTDAGHLALDAVVAFVDEELPPGPAQRAAAHVDRCLTCAAEVAAQRQARRRVRAAECPAVPSSLLSALRSIPDVAPLPGPPAGLSVAPDGSLVVPVDPPTGEDGDPATRPRRGRRRFGLPVALSSGVVAGAAALVALGGPALVSGTPTGAPAGVAVRPVPTAAADLAARRDAAPTAAAATTASSATTASTAAAAPAVSTAPAPGPALPGPGAP